MIGFLNTLSAEVQSYRPKGKVNSPWSAVPQTEFFNYSIFLASNKKITQSGYLIFLKSQYFYLVLLLFNQNLPHIRKFPRLPGIIALTAILITTVFISGRKIDQKPAEQTAVEKLAAKNFFSVPAGTEDIVHEVAKKIYRQNERKPFAEDLVKRVGYPAWSHSLIADGPGSTRQAAQKGSPLPSDPTDPTDPGNPCEEVGWVTLEEGEAIPCKVSFNFVKQGNWQSAVITDYRFTFYERKTNKDYTINIGNIETGMPSVTYDGSLIHASTAQAMSAQAATLAEAEVMHVVAAQVIVSPGSPIDNQYYKNMFKQFI